MRDPREPTQARPADAVGRIGTAMTSSVIAGAALGAVRATWSVSANDFCPFSCQHASFVPCPWHLLFRPPRSGRLGPRLRSRGGTDDA